MTREETLVHTVSNARCRLTVSLTKEITKDGREHCMYYVFNVAHRARGSKQMKALCIGLHYTDLLLAVSHGRFIYDLCTEIVDTLLETDPKIGIQLERIKNEINLRYTQAVKETLSDTRGRCFSTAFSNGDGKQLGLRLNFWENRKTRLAWVSLPRDVDFLWAKFDRLPFPRTNELGS